MSWEVYSLSDENGDVYELHVCPTEEEHEVDDCPCNPRYLLHKGIMKVYHNSFDGREGLEMALEILNPPKS